MQMRSMTNGAAVREYAAGSLWVVPAVSSAAALVAGLLLSQVQIDPHSVLAPLAFQGTADDARTLLIAIASTVVTVIALVLGLTVVALQLSSTQFSPRLLRNFLRDRATQRVLGVYLATFVYSGAGLYTVGVASGARVEQFPRLAVTGAIVLLFATLGMVVYFADHLAHSLQIDRITELVQTSTLAVVRASSGTVETDRPDPPAWAVAVPATRSGYVETAHPARLLPLASRLQVTVLLRTRVGEHVVEGSPLAWVWTPSAADPIPGVAGVRSALDRAVRIGFERTLEQDCGFGIRQLVDVACKALSPAINDPYTAVQAIDHLAVICCALAARPLGDDVARDSAGSAVVIVPGRRFGEYIDTMCGLIRRYGGHEPTVLVALLRLLDDCRGFTGGDEGRNAELGHQARLILEDAERSISQPADIDQVRRAAVPLLAT
ncbi:MAG TPA: DUF2254 domain-containing protein [Amnibacterium sp.]|nr:DUF2254 domain-containing protein [Amnibacterium sp.]